MKVFNKNPTATTIASRQITEQNHTEENTHQNPNTLISGSNIKVCSYDINDFLPEPIEATKFHIINLQGSSMFKNVVSNHNDSYTEK